MHALQIICDIVVITKPFLEWLFFLSGTVLCFIAFRGLKQIDLLKADMLARSERSAKEKAIEAIGVFLNQFMPSYAKLMAAWIEKKQIHMKGQSGNSIQRNLKPLKKKKLRTML